MNAPVTLSATGTTTTGTVIFEDGASTSALNATNNLVTNGLQQ
jgi:hypothetical protein